MKRQSISIFVVVVALVLSAGPVLASAPEPVIAVPGGDDSPAYEPPAYDPTEPYRDDRSGRCPAGNTRMGSDGQLELTAPSVSTRQPGPVIAVDPAPVPEAAPCLAEVGLHLLVEAPAGKKPDGADGSLDGIAVSRSSLEGGFEVTLPAQDRLITLSDPGENWELKSTSCDCSGWTTASAPLVVASAPGSLTAYPQPVVAVDPAPSGGPGGCSGAAPVGSLSGTSAPSLPVSGGLPEMASYPGPVIALDPLRLQAPRVEWDEAGTVTITDPDLVGGTFTCVWTVELVYGQLEIETTTRPTGEEGRFRYEVVPTGEQPEATAFTVRGSASERLRWGPWSVDLAELPEGWKVKRSSCSEADISLLSLADGPSAQVGLDPDDRVDCRFELELLAPRPGRWKADNKAGTVVCSRGDYAIPFDLSRAIDFGRLQVRDEGDTLVARGGGNSFTFRRDRDEPLRYEGTKRFKQAGFTLDFDIRLDLKSETRMTGSLLAKAKGKGSTCTIRRPLTLTHASAN